MIRVGFICDTFELGGQELGCLALLRRLDRKRFLWPAMADGVVTVSVAQLSYLLSGIDWRMPQEVWRPQVAG